MAVGFGEPDRQFAWARLRLLKRHHDNALPDVVGNAVPNPTQLRRLVFEASGPPEPVIPAIEYRCLHPEHLQRSPGRQMRLLDEADDLKLLKMREGSCLVSPINGCF